MAKKKEIENPVQDQAFDYSKAIAELEQIASVVEDPDTSLDDIGKYMARSKELVSSCREYLRSVRQSVEAVTE